MISLIMKDGPTQTSDNAPKIQISLAHLFLFFLLFAVLYGVFLIIRPYLNTILLAIILGSVFYPLHTRIEKYIGERKNLAAFISCTILIVLVVFPLTMILVSMIQQGIHSFNAIYDWLQEGNLEKILASGIGRKITLIFNRFLPGFDIKKISLDRDLMKLSSSVGKFLLDQGGSILGNITGIIAKFFMMIFVFFFIERDGDRILKGLLHLIPLSTSQESRIIHKIRDVSKSALLGTLVTGAAQGAAGGIAFWIAGLPGLFWGVMMAFASLIPVVGTALVWVPAAIYLFLAHKAALGVFMILWGALLVGSIDSFLRPYFMKGSAGMSPVLIFFAILGGINMFGLMGILYGPLIFGLATVLLYIYELEFESYLNRQDQA